MNFLLLIFLVALLTYTFAGRHLMLVLLSLELMIFVVTMRFLYFGWFFDDLSGALAALYLLVLAGAESAIALSLLVLFHRVRGSIKLY